jgi:DNA repair protein RadC
LPNILLEIPHGDHRLARGRATARAPAWPGAASLSDAELLAIFLRVGSKGKSAVDLARELIGRFGGLNPHVCGLEAEFSAVPGMGPAKYAQLQAVFELARRSLAEEMKQRSTFASPGAVRDYLRLHFAGLEHEVFVACGWMRRTA